MSVQIKMIAAIVIISMIVISSEAFSRFSAIYPRRSAPSVQMVAQYGSYVPDGLTAQQWNEIRTKEALSKKGNLGAVGIQKFKSRSMQAFQEAKEAGLAKHLFPVNTKTTPLEERPYMMRRGGDWESNDLQQKGLVPKKQAEASVRISTDDKYDEMRKAGRLNTVSIFSSIMGGGAKLPWTIDQ